MGKTTKQLRGENMTINFRTPEIKELKPRILVLGVGGAGVHYRKGALSIAHRYRPTTDFYEPQFLKIQQVALWSS